MIYKLPQSVLVVVHTADLSVLLLERADTAEPRWQSVTGSREPDDMDLLATARRELCEETGLDCHAPEAAGWALHDWGVRNEYEIWPAWRPRYAPDVTHNVEHVFGLTLPARCDVRLALDEHRASIWLPWQEAVKRCFSPTNRRAIEMLPRMVGAR